MASIISLVVNPADARFSIPSAASPEENAVSAPSLIAWSFNFSNSSPVAPEIAFTRDICASKSEPVFTAARPIPSRATLVPVIAVIAVFNPLEANFPIFETAFPIPVLDNFHSFSA